ncbi:MAG: response regulator [Pseudomonadota bacterium]
MKFKRPRQAAPPDPVIMQEPFFTGGKAARVLVAHSDEALRAAIASRLKEKGFTVMEAAGAGELGEHVSALADVCGAAPAVDAVIAHSAMPGLSGLHVLRALRSSGCSTPVILIMARDDDETRDRALFLGAAAVFVEPVILEHLLIALINVTRTFPAAGDRTMRL